jgi:hypothetical protein
VIESYAVPKSFLALVMMLVVRERSTPVTKVTPPIPVTVVVGYDPISPVIMTPPVVKVIAEPPRIAKFEAEPRFTATWAITCDRQTAKPTITSRIKCLTFMA